MPVYLNGKILPEKDAKISPLDRGFLFGDGLFETMRSYQGRIFLLQKHLNRLFSSAQALKIKIRLSKNQLADACNQTLAANRIKNGRIRLTISRGKFLGQIGLKQDSEPTILITASRLAQKKSDGPMEITLAKCDFSLPKKFPLAKHKTLSYLPYLLALEQAEKKGAQEALLLTERGILLETSRANLFLVKDSVLKTPSLNLPILPGITRANVIELARKQGIKVIAGEFTEKDLFSSDLAFLTNSILEIALVKSYRGKKFKNQQALALAIKLLSVYRDRANSDLSARRSLGSELKV